MTKSEKSKPSPPMAVFVQVIPEVKRRQFKQAVDAYESPRRRDAKRG